MCWQQLAYGITKSKLHYLICTVGAQATFLCPVCIVPLSATLAPYHMEMILIYPVFIGIALATAQLAHDKGYSGKWWFLFGLVLPIISLLILFMLKRKPKKLTGLYAPIEFEHQDKVLYKKEEDSSH